MGEEIKGKHVAITGALLFYRREDAFSLIRECGGIPNRYVTRETDYLVKGQYRRNMLRGEKSNKQIRAEKYISQGKDLRIIDEDELLSMLWNG